MIESRTILIQLVGLATLACVSLPSVYAQTTHGAEANPTGNPIAGGPGYSRIVPFSSRTYIVTSPLELSNALSVATSGETVFVPGGVTIDVGSASQYVIPSGVTLASDRGYGNSPGAMLRRAQYSVVTPLLKAGGSNVRVTGLRLVGPDATTSALKLGQGFVTDYLGSEVDNNEMSGWSHYAVRVGDDALLRASSFANIHHNSIHHNQAWGLGYGVVVAGGRAEIGGNYFDYNRHSVASSGYPGSGYTLNGNIINANNTVTFIDPPYPGSSPVGTQFHSYPIDVHGYPSPGNSAGDYVVVQNNSFFDSDSEYGSVRAEGVPSSTGASNVRGNWSMQASTRFISQLTDPSQVGGWGTFGSFVNLDVSQNSNGWGAFNDVPAGGDVRNRMGDFNGDGRLDRIHFLPSAQFSVELALPGGGFGPASTWGANGADLYDRYKIGDPDGDGRADVISFESNGGVYVWRSLGNVFAPFVQWFSTSDTGAACAALRSHTPEARIATTGDANVDGVCNSDDLKLLVLGYQSSVKFAAATGLNRQTHVDLDGNGVISFADLRRAADTHPAAGSGLVNRSLNYMLIDQASDFFDDFRVNGSAANFFGTTLQTGVSYLPGQTRADFAGAGSLSADGKISFEDIDALAAAGLNDLRFDLTGDGVVNSSDADELIVSILRTRFGDANLDRVVNSVDFNLFVSGYGSIVGRWNQGDFNLDRRVNSLDFNLLAANFGVGAAPIVGVTVPEPAVAVTALAFGLALRRRGCRLRSYPLR